MCVDEGRALDIDVEEHIWLKWESFLEWLVELSQKYIFSLVRRAVTPGRGSGCDKSGKLNLNHDSPFTIFRWLQTLSLGHSGGLE